MMPTLKVNKRIPVPPRPRSPFSVPNFFFPITLVSVRPCSLSLPAVHSHTPSGNALSMPPTTCGRYHHILRLTHVWDACTSVAVSQVPPIVSVPDMEEGRIPWCTSQAPTSPGFSPAMMKVFMGEDVEETLHDDTVMVNEKSRRD